MNGGAAIQQDTEDAPSEHIDQSIPYEWHAVDLDDRMAVVRDVPEGTAELFIVAAVSRNIRTVARADHALYKGKVVEPVYDEDTGTVEFYHDYAGRVGRHAVTEWASDPIIRLHRMPSAPDEKLLEVGR